MALGGALWSPWKSLIPGCTEGSRAARGQGARSVALGRVSPCHPRVSIRLVAAGKGGGRQPPAEPQGHPDRGSAETFFCPLLRGSDFCLGGEGDASAQCEFKIIEMARPSGPNRQQDGSQQWAGHASGKGQIMEPPPFPPVSFSKTGMCPAGQGGTRPDSGHPGTKTTWP